MSDGVLRVVQLNAGSLLEPDWSARRHEIVAWLVRLDPDVICLQEVWESENKTNTAAWIAERLDGYWHHVFGGFPFDGGLSPDPTVLFGSAVLSRWPIAAQHTFRLPVAADAEPAVADVPWELVHAETAGLDVFSTHLAAAPEWGLHRRLQVLAIDEHIRRLRGDKDAFPVPRARRRWMPAILCGDFNAEPDSDEIRFLASLTVLDGRSTFYQDAWRVAGGDGPGFTQDWRVNSIAGSMNVHRKRIDYVFVGDPFIRKGGGGRVLTAEVVFDEPLTGLHASDHAGLVVDIVWPDKPGR